MIMEWVKRSNNEIFALGNDLEFDGQEFNFNNTILRFTGQLAWNFKHISWNTPNQAVFSYLQELYKDVAIFSGIDITALMGSWSKTAYQTAVQQEIYTKRVNNSLSLRDIAYERIANIHMANLKMYFPRKMVRELIEIWEEWKATYPKIKLEKEKEVGEELIGSKEDNVFEVKPDKIRWDFKISVRTNFNQPTLNVEQRENLMQWLNAIMQVEQMAAQSKDIEQNKEALIKEIKVMYNMPQWQWDDKKWIQEAKAKLMEWVALATGQWWPQKWVLDELQGMLPQMQAQLTGNQQQNAPNGQQEAQMS